MKSTDLLMPAGSRWPRIVGVACAIIAFLFAGLLLWVLYLVGWRNPREYGVNELFQPKTLSFFAILFIISLGFAILSRRLLSTKPQTPAVLSPFALRAWAVFFVLTTVLVLGNAIQKKDWRDLPNILTIASTMISMTVAAFVLAKRRARKPPGISKSPLDV